LRKFLQAKKVQAILSHQIDLKSLPQIRQHFFKSLTK